MKVRNSSLSPDGLRSTSRSTRSLTGPARLQKIRHFDARTSSCKSARRARPSMSRFLSGL